MTGVPDDALAITGMAGRFPGASGVEEFWANNLKGVSAVTRRTNATGGVLWARGELDNVAAFDPDFFGMSPRDALLLDPQHRLLLECAWEALADAGPSAREHAHRTAIFAGANYSGYRDLLERSGACFKAVEFEAGVDKDFLSTTIAYRLGFEGPCLTVQTACSSSLVAVHLAAQTLLEFDADQALAGGVSIVLPHTPGWRFEPSGIHSADGICRPFDTAANGTVMGDGAAIVVLRRLEDAIEDGCRIYAVLLGSAVNNDGARKMGYAAPSLPGQVDVIRLAQARSGVRPGDIGFIEAHGTGTPLGDRIEFQALREVFSENAPIGRCALASVKGAIGHLDIAAGVTGLIRAALALYFTTIPGTVNHENSPGDIAMGNSPFYVPKSASPWIHDGLRRAGVSSFGIGGTNAHLVLQEYRAVTHQATLPSRPTLIDAGYRPRRFWPATDFVPSKVGTEVVTKTSVEYRRATWREWVPDGAQPDRPDYERVVLIADANATSDRMHALLACEHDIIRLGDGASGDEAFLAIELLCSAPVSGRVLVVCSWAVASQRQGRRCYDALAALGSRWLKGNRPAGGLDVVMLTRGAYAVTRATPADPDQASLSGLARVLSMETPTLRARVIDVPLSSDCWLPDVVEAVMTWHDEPVLVLSGRRWWHRVYEPASTPARLAVGAPRRGASVVIGVGQVGSAAARVLALTDTPIVLAVRSVRGTERVEALRHELGLSTVYIESCDAADPKEVRALLTRVVQRFGGVDQVVLAAGISGDGAYQVSSALPQWRDEEHFRIKVEGVAALAEAAALWKFRRIILMSSLAGVLGAISLGPYSAAAAAMDSSVDRYDQEGVGWLSVGWDAWWHGSGTASAHESRMVQNGLTNAEATMALEDLLLSNATGHLLVVKGDFDDRWERFVRTPLRCASTSTTRRPSRKAHTVSEVQLTVLDTWRTCLGDPGLALDDDLIEHGADSLNAIDVLVGLGERFDVTLPTDLVFEMPTAGLLASRIVELLSLTEPTGDCPGIRDWGSRGPTVWCLHPISGVGDAYGSLADLLGEYRVRAVVGKPLAEAEEEDLEAQASRYYEALVTTGAPPAVVVGWSYGGILAFAVAHHARRTSGLLPPLILLDVPAPTVPRTRHISDVSDLEILIAIMLHRIRENGHTTTLNFARLLREGKDDAISQLLAGLRADGVIPPGLTAEIATRLVTGYRRRMRALEQYRPLPYPAPVTLLRAAEVEFGNTGVLHGVLPAPVDDPGWGWSALTPAGLTVEVLEGHHSTLLRPPAVAAVARSVRKAMSAKGEE